MIASRKLTFFWNYLTFISPLAARPTGKVYVWKNTGGNLTKNGAHPKKDAHRCVALLLCNEKVKKASVFRIFWDLQKKINAIHNSLRQSRRLLARLYIVRWQMQFCSTWKAFDCSLTPECGTLFGQDFIVHQCDRSAGAGIFCTFAGLMGAQPCGQVICPASVKGTVRTTQDIYKCL